MFCTNCGAKLVEGARFCQKCGQAANPDAINPVRSVVSEKVETKKQSYDNGGVVSQKNTNERYSKVIGVLTTIAMIGFGRYVGIYIVIPFAGGFAAYWLFNKMLSKEKELVVLAASVQSGHLLWMIVGAFFLGAEGFTAVWLDALILLAGIIWLVAKPTKAPIIFLGIYQILSIIVNVVTISSLSPSEENFKALIVHIALRAFGLIAMFLALREMRKTKLS